MYLPLKIRTAFISTIIIIFILILSFTIIYIRTKTLLYNEFKNKMYEDKNMINEIFDEEFKSNVLPEMEHDLNPFNLNFELKVFNADGSLLINILNKYTENDFKLFDIPLNLKNNSNILMENNNFMMLCWKKSFSSDNKNNSVYTFCLLEKKDYIKNILNKILLYFYLIVAFIVVIILPLNYYAANIFFKPMDNIINKVRALNLSENIPRIPEPVYKDELFQLSNTLNKMIERVEQSFKSEKIFFKNAAHELKTPVSNLLIITDTLLKKIDTRSSSFEILNDLKIEIIKLQKKIESFFYLSSYDKNINNNLTFININDFLMLSFEKFENLFKKNNISFSHSIQPCVLETNKEYLGIVIDNIIDNAIKFIGSPRKIIVTGKIIDDNYNISFFNSGDSLNERELDKIFNRMYRGKYALLNNIPGTGLGLSVCKEIITLLGGIIAVNNNLDGVLFTITLPINK